LGVDLLPERVEAARRSHPSIQFIQADAATLDAPASYFRLILAFTVFSSILDRAMAQQVAAQIDRVLAPGGALLWYDYRVSRPSNPHTIGMPKRRIRELFPAYDLDLRSVTLLPQLARRLGRRARFYPVLAHIPLLRTHYVGLLSKRG
jgi:ubiquinone/menaquinone biosynthesis C-methylase UbiE